MRFGIGARRGTTTMNRSASRGFGLESAPGNALDPVERCRSYSAAGLPPVSAQSVSGTNDYRHQTNRPVCWKATGTGTQLLDDFRDRNSRKYPASCRSLVCEHLRVQFALCNHPSLAISLPRLGKMSCFSELSFVSWHLPLAHSETCIAYVHSWST
jgi:hypothetical protein